MEKMTAAELEGFSTLFVGLGLVFMSLGMALTVIATVVVNAAFEERCGVREAFLAVAAAVSTWILMAVMFALESYANWLTEALT